MKRIWKYELPGLTNNIEVPAGGIVRHVAALPGCPPTLWIEVDPSQPLTERVFRTVATGSSVPDGTVYIGTALLSDGTVWHVHEVADHQPLRSPARRAAVRPGSEATW